MFEKILLPTDGSRHSLEAARIAADLATRHRGTVTPLVTVEYQYVTGGDLPEEIAAAIRARIEGRARQALDAAIAAAREAGAQVDEGQVVEGPAPETIVEVAEDGQYDLIVMGSRGVSVDDGRDRLIGSVTERVLHNAPCPVLVIRAEPRP
ncbi:MAG: universal stress protein [Armatimonadota bacterium]